MEICMKYPLSATFRVNIFSLHLTDKASFVVDLTVVNKAKIFSSTQTILFLKTTVAVLIKHALYCDIHIWWKEKIQNLWMLHLYNSFNLMLGNF